MVGQQSSEQSKSKKTKRRDVVSHDDDGLLIVVYKGRRRIAGHRRLWSEVVLASAFKRDLGVGDLVCIELCFRSQKRVELHEEMEGWPTLLDRLPAHLAGFPPRSEWWQRLAVPASRASRILLYQRPEEPDGA
jgi:hypothetical protein